MAYLLVQLVAQMVRARGLLFLQRCTSCEVCGSTPPRLQFQMPSTLTCPAAWRDLFARRQNMYGDMFAKALTTFVVVTVIIALPVGWAFIEGLIWLYNHVSVSLK